MDGREASHYDGSWGPNPNRHQGKSNENFGDRLEKTHVELNSRRYRQPPIHYVQGVVDGRKASHYDGS